MTPGCLKSERPWASVTPRPVLPSINTVLSLARKRVSSPLVVESVVLHSLVRKIPKLVVRRGHMCLIALNNGVLILHLTTHSLHTFIINQQGGLSVE